MIKITDNISVEMVDTRKLYVNKDYQYKPRSHSVNLIQKQFDIALFGVPEVAEESDGRYAVMDGQTRLQTAQRLKKLPDRVVCRVHRGLSLQDQAALFVKLNGNRSPVPSIGNHAAAVTAGTPSAVAVQNQLNAMGLSFSPTKSTTAITAVEAVYRLYKAGAMSRILRIAKQWAQDSGRAEAFDGKSLTDLAYFVTAEVVADDILSEKLAAVDPRHALKMVDSEKTVRGCDRKTAALLTYRKIYSPPKKRNKQESVVSQ